MISKLEEEEKIDESLNISKIVIQGRENNDHDHKMFEIKFEYGFREQAKIQRIKNQKNGKIKLKRSMNDKNEGEQGNKELKEKKKL